MKYKKLLDLLKSQEMLGSVDEICKIFNADHPVVKVVVDGFIFEFLFCCIDDEFGEIRCKVYENKKKIFAFNDEICGMENRRAVASFLTHLKHFLFHLTEY